MYLAVSLIRSFKSFINAFSRDAFSAPSGAAKKESKNYLQHFKLEAYGKGHPGLLFNLKEDPRQSKNLYAKHPEKVESMRSLLKRYIGGERCAPARR